MVNSMFEVGDYIVYGVNGVCKVEKVGPMETYSGDKNKLYYSLIPIYLTGSRIITPIDNQKVNMRHVISKEEANSLIKDMESCNEPIWIHDDRQREQLYKKAIKESDCKQLIKMIKALYLRRQLRIAEGKKSTAFDEKYSKLAEECLYGEFAIALDMEKNQVSDYISRCLNIAE